MAPALRRDSFNFLPGVTVGLNRLAKTQPPVVSPPPTDADTTAVADEVKTTDTDTDTAE